MPHQLKQSLRIMDFNVDVAPSLGAAKEGMAVCIVSIGVGPAMMCFPVGIRDATVLTDAIRTGMNVARRAVRVAAGEEEA